MAAEVELGSGRSRISVFAGERSSKLHQGFGAEHGEMRAYRMPSAQRPQCDELPSSLLLVANRIDATKTAMMTGTTKNGEVMCITQAPCCCQINK